MAQTASIKLHRRLAKRGRPRIEGVYREGNGRASRAKEPIDKLALETRARKLGLTVIEAKNQLAASFIGRLHMQYQTWEKRANADVRAPIDSLSHGQYAALVKFRDLHNDRLKIVQSPGAYYDSIGSGSGDGEAHEKWAANVTAQYVKARAAITEEQMQNRTENLWAALDYCLLRDEAHHHMINGLRILGNTLARHWRIER